MTDYDSPWKEALDVYFQPFLAFFFPQIHREIDWACGYESLDKELQQVVRDAELGRRLVDKLVKVWRLDGREEWVLIHIEVQGRYEAEFAQRIYVYNYRIFDRYNRPVVSLAVLADENANWRPSSFSNALWGCTAGIQFPVVKLLDYAASWPALEANPNPFATVVLAHLKTQETRGDDSARHTWKMRLVRGLYERGFSAQDVRHLFRFIDWFIDWLMDLPPVLENLFKQDLARFEEERRMPYITSVERAGIRKGLLTGIEVCLRIKFGAEGLQLMPELRSLHDEEKLEAVLQAIESASTLEEVRRTWSE